ncbi:MAG: hypothetical protein AAFU65_15205, partial [Pseudomonadota bacterium]
MVVTGSRIENVMLETAQPVTTVSREDYSAKAGGRRLLNQFASDVKVQAGPGLPSWASRSSSLSWTGPIAKDQTFRLVILPPWALSLWRLLSVALTLFVVATLARRLARQWRDPDEPSDVERSPPTTATTAASVMALGLALSAAAPVADAQVPAPELLETLEKRLTDPPPCAPECVTIERAQININRDALSMRLVVHAQAAAAVALPGTPAGWHPTQVSVDGEASDRLSRPHEQLAVPITAGVHRIALTGPLPAATSVTVEFPLAPTDIEVQGTGWDTSGIVDRRLTAKALTLARVDDSSSDGSDTFDAMDVERFPVFVRVHRHLVFDLDWKVFTTVTRVTPPTAAINVAVPLLPDEAVSRDDLNIVNGVASVALAPGQNRIQWQSTLTRTSPLTLVAALDTPWQETWRVEAGPNWRLTHRGVPQDNEDPARHENWQIGFTPWPGETLVVDITRPTPVDGPTLAIDNVNLSKTVGRRGARARRRDAAGRVPHRCRQLG